jgi:hypothetical protein
LRIYELEASRRSVWSSAAPVAVCALRWTPVRVGPLHTLGPVQPSTVLLFHSGVASSIRSLPLCSPALTYDELPFTVAATGPEPGRAPDLAGAGSEASRRGCVGRRAQMPAGRGGVVGGTVVDGGGGGGGAGGRGPAEPVAFGLLPARGTAAAERDGAGCAGAGVHGARADAPSRGGASNEGPRHHPPLR